MSERLEELLQQLEVLNLKPDEEKVSKDKFLVLETVVESESQWKIFVNHIACAVHWSVVKAEVGV